MVKDTLPKKIGPYPVKYYGVSSYDGKTKLPKNLVPYSAVFEINRRKAGRVYLHYVFAVDKFEIEKRIAMLSKTRKASKNVTYKIIEEILTENLLNTFGSRKSQDSFTRGNLNALKNFVKGVDTAFYAYKKVAGKGGGYSRITFTPSGPTELSVILTKPGEPRPDIIYLVRDRDAIEKAGIFPEVLPAHEKFGIDPTTVYRLSVRNGVKGVNNFGDPNFLKFLGIFADAFPDPALNAVLSRYAMLIQYVPYGVDHTLEISHRIPFNGAKGSVYVGLVSKGRSLPIEVPNPNKNGRKAKIKISTALSYAYNENVAHTHSRTKWKRNALSLEWLKRA